MNKDAIERMALTRAVELSAAIEVQIEKSKHWTPLGAVLSLAREQAGIAMRGLVMVEPSDTAKVGAFQNEVRRYDDLVVWLRQIVVEGKEADRRLSELDRIEFESLVLEPEIQAERDQLRGERPQED